MIKVIVLSFIIFKINNARSACVGTPNAGAFESPLGLTSCVEFKGVLGGIYKKEIIGK